MVGVNDHTDDDTPHMHMFEVGEEVRQREIDRLDQVRAQRDSRAVASSLEALRRFAADESKNLMPSILDAVRAYCSVGEIWALRGLRRISFLAAAIMSATATH